MTVVLLQEALGPLSLVGAAIVICGLVIAQRPGPS